MKYFQTLVKFALSIGLGVSIFSCGSGGGSSSSNKAVIVPPTTDLTVPTEDIQFLFEEDVAEDIRQSEPDDINLPLGLQAAFDIEYLGAFRVNSDGQSTSDYAVGTLGFNPDHNSIFMVGHSHQNAVAEFEIPSKLSFETQPSNILEAAVLQKYITVLDKKSVGNTTNKINGILYYKQNLLVSSEIWYDGEANNRDNLQTFSNAYDISSSGFTGMLQIEGEAKAAGYMSKVPLDSKEKVGSEYVIGWASNYSITSRYSQGPSLYRFSPNQALALTSSGDRIVDTEPLMVFPLAEGTQLVEGGDEYKLDISPIWGPVAQARYGFIIPDSTYFLVLGSHSGLHSGIGYKITQDNGNLCGGPCPYQNTDMYNYFWIFDINDMVDAEEPWLVRPISYGKWSHPYDKKGGNQVLGGAYDDQNSILYIALSSAAKVDRYDNPPLIISYQVKAK